MTYLITRGSADLAQIEAANAAAALANWAASSGVEGTITRKGGTATLSADGVGLIRAERVAGCVCGSKRSGVYWDGRGICRCRGGREIIDSGEGDKVAAPARTPAKATTNRKENTMSETKTPTAPAPTKAPAKKATSDPAKDALLKTYAGLYKDMLATAKKLAPKGVSVSSTEKAAYYRLGFTASVPHVAFSGPLDGKTFAYVNKATKKGLRVEIPRAATGYDVYSVTDAASAEKAITEAVSRAVARHTPSDPPVQQEA